MTPVLTRSARSSEKPFSSPWITITWVTILLVACYAPILNSLVRIWADDPDMGHGFFVPLIAGYIAWQKRDKLAGITIKPNWWGLAIMMWAAFQLYIATLGAELFLARTSLVFSIVGAVLLIGGTECLRLFG